MDALSYCSWFRHHKLGTLRCRQGRAASTPSLGCNALIYNDAVFLNVFAADFSGKQRAKSVPPKPDGLVADVDTALVQQVLDVPE
jgi:hypothetical protein